MSFREMFGLDRLNMNTLKMSLPWAGLANKTWKRQGKPSYEDLMNAESELGRTLFGPIPAGHQREFFAAKKNVWIWHEQWTNYAGEVQEMTIRYEVRPTGVFKRANGGTYQKIGGEELNNFRRAAQAYLGLVKSKLYC